MKKTLLCSVVLLSVFLLVSCGGTKEAEETTRKKVSQGEVTELATETTEEKNESVDLSGYFFSKTYEQPANLRETVVGNMRDMANFEWTCASDCTYTRKLENYSFTLTLKKGQTYLGLPYGNARVNLTEFQTYLDNGSYAPEGENWNDILGVQCITSIFCAMQDVADIDGASEQMDPANEKLFNMKTVGNYTVTNGNKSEAVCSSNGNTKMYECYSEMSEGDAVFTNSPNIHARLIVKNDVVLKTDGTVNERRSKVTTIEQTDGFDKLVKERSNSTWWVDHTYTYEELFTKNYVPVTLEAYTTGGEAAYIALDRETSVSDLSQGNLLGTVSTNRTIRFAIYTLTDANGNVVSQQRATNLNNKKTVNNRDFAYNLFNGLANGNYTFTLTAGIGTHEETLQTTEFTYSK